MILLVVTWKLTSIATYLLPLDTTRAKDVGRLVVTSVWVMPGKCPFAVMSTLTTSKFVSRYSLTKFWAICPRLFDWEPAVIRLTQIYLCLMNVANLSG